MQDNLAVSVKFKILWNIKIIISFFYVSAIKIMKAIQGEMAEGNAAGLAGASRETWLNELGDIYTIDC